MKLAVVKPDHLGDLVLSAPAIRAVLDKFPETTLFVSSRNLGLARMLFRVAELRPLDLPHLAKSGEDAGTPVDFADFDMVMFLRRDQLLNPQQMHLLCKDFIFFNDSNRYHQSLLDYTLTSRVAGSYDIDRMFYRGDGGSIRDKALRPPQSVGLCIGAGFHANAWPAAHWLALGKKLQADGRRVAIICGPSEIATAGIIGRGLGLPDKAVIRGDDDYQRFLRRVRELDWVVASDGGSAHLCSLAVPILSLFGGSPFRRYAPFGKWNRLLTFELPCSPCCQYMNGAINGCLSTECMVGITPDRVLEVLDSTYSEMAPSGVDLGDHLRLYFGASHLDRRRLEAP